MGEVQLSITFTAGPDGIPAGLSQNMWEMVKDDVVAAVRESRSKQSILKELNTTFVAFIPNKQEAKVVYSYSQ